MFGNLGLRYRKTKGHYYEKANHKQTNKQMGCGVLRQDSLDLSKKMLRLSETSCKKPNEHDVTSPEYLLVQQHYCVNRHINWNMTCTKKKQDYYAINQTSTYIYGCKIV